MARFATESVTVDAMVIDSAPGNNYGTNVNINIGVYTNGVEYRGFYALPSTSLGTGEGVVGSVLTLTKSSSGVDNDAGGDIDVYRVLASWSETGITWANQPATEYVKTVTVAPATTNQSFDIDITGADIGHGVMLTASDFYATQSAEASASYRPKVTYEVDVVVAGQDIYPASIASAETFGTPALETSQALVLVGIGSGEAFGVPGLSEYVPPALVLLPGGLASEETFGQPALGLVAPGFVPLPTGQDVADFLDAPVADLAEVHVGVITEFARVWTRGNGFSLGAVSEPVASVILAAAARLVSNPDQLDIQVGSVRRASFFQGWTLAEQRVLNDYRKVAS